MQAEYVIVGAGSAGCALAFRLAEAGRSVIVIEHGEKRAPDLNNWHTDVTFMAQPPLGSVLHAKVMPDTGGDTMWASMYAAYEALSPGLKQTLEGLQAWHSSRHVFGYSTNDLESRKDGRIANADKAVQDALHPVVITHPLSGRKALYVNGDFTVRFDGWTKDESQPLLDPAYRSGSH